MHGNKFKVKWRPLPRYCHLRSLTVDVASDCGEGTSLGGILPIFRDRVIRAVRMLATNKAIIQIVVEVTIKLVKL